MNIQQSLKPVINSVYKSSALKIKLNNILVVFQIEILVEVSIKIKIFLSNEEIYGAKSWNWPWYTHNSKLHSIFLIFC